MEVVCWLVFLLQMQRSNARSETDRCSPNGGKFIQTTCQTFDKKN